LSEKKTVSRNVAVAFAALCIVSLIVLSLALASYWQQSSLIQDKDNQIQDLQEQLSSPQLVSIGLEYNDNRQSSPMLEVKGYVVNVGCVTANNCTLHITAIQSGNATAIDMSRNFGSIEAGAYKQISLEFPYSGTALVAYNPQLQWTG